VDGQIGVKVSEGGVVRAGLGEREAHEPANKQVGRQHLLQGGVGAAVGPGAHDLSTNELGDGELRRAARGARSVMEARSGGDHGGRVIRLGEQHEGMLGAAPQ